MSSVWETIRKFLVLICHILIGIHLYVYWFHFVEYANSVPKYLARKEHKCNMAHIFLSGTGIAFCFPEGLLLFDPANYNYEYSSKTNRLLHWLWFGFGSIFIFLAAILMVATQKLVGAHVFIGLISMILITVAAVLGVLMIMNSMRDKRAIKLAFLIIGIIGYILGMMSLIYIYHYTGSGHIRRKYKESYLYTTNPGITGRWELTLILLYICAVTLIAPIEILMNRLDVDWL